MSSTVVRAELWEQLRSKIKTLNETVWDKKVGWADVTKWIGQFKTSAQPEKDEQLQALYVLSHFMYFGLPEIRALLRSTYRDFFHHHIVEQVRRRNGDTRNPALVRKETERELKRTRFVALGNPSESSAMLLYFFRQQNALPKDLFVNAVELLDLTSGNVKSRSSTMAHYVFLDDLCGSGQQGVEYGEQVAQHLKGRPGVSTYYYALFGCSTGLDRIRKTNFFDVADAVVELDPSFKCFEPESRIYSAVKPPFDRLSARAIAEMYGNIQLPGHPLGYEDGQLLLGFEHNTPDNTLPIFWMDEQPGTSWIPLFKRYPKTQW
jgi:hypothetical protein